MIIVLGAPRTGTTSCAHALQQLEQNVLQYCPLTKTDTLADIQSILESGHSEYNAIVSSHFNESLVRRWITTFPNATFIHCTRNESQRVSSMHALGYESEVTRDTLKQITAALKETGRYFELNCDWPGNWKWQTLQSALGLNKDRIPDAMFPHSNTSVILEKNNTESRFSALAGQQ